ncbi:MAG TPA: 30S ribosome-binding factor RbfA [Acidimicrobiia bacterium]|nr:30S ribosome-binding factor RbfA [Acidimicrobiia bacterium]
MGRGPRMRRVNETLREIIADELERLKDPGLGFVTITGVDTAPDLRTAKVYYSVLGDEDQAQQTADALHRAAKRIRAVVGGQVRMKYLPELDFLPDEAIERGIRIEALLREIREEHDDAGDRSIDHGGG